MSIRDVFQVMFIHTTQQGHFSWVDDYIENKIRLAVSNDSEQHVPLNYHYSSVQEHYMKVGTIYALKGITLNKFNYSYTTFFRI